MRRQEDLENVNSLLSSVLSKYFTNKAFDNYGFWKKFYFLSAVWTKWEEETTDALQTSAVLSPCSQMYGKVHGEVLAWFLSSQGFRGKIRR